MSTSRQTEIVAALKAGDKLHARDLLRGELREQPSAEAWYLAAHAAGSREQAINFLEKALDLDPFHEQAHKKLAQLRPQPQVQLDDSSVQALVGPSRQQLTNLHTRETELLNYTINVFNERQWELKHSSPTLVQFEKKAGSNTLLAFLVVVFLGLFGSLIIVLDIAISKQVRVTFQTSGKGYLVFTSNKKKGQFKYQTYPEIAATAKSVRTGTTSYAGVLALGFIFTFCGLALLGY